MKQVTPVNLSTLPVPEDKPWTKELAKQMTYHYAAHYGVSGSFMWAIINCESGGDRWADNPRTSATGIAQILLSAHPDITKEQAYDPYFSLDWTAGRLAKGQASAWAQCLP